MAALATAREGCRLRLLAAGASLCALLVAAPALAQSPPALRGSDGQVDPRSITVDPRSVPPAPAFETRSLAPLAGGVAAPAAADAAQGANGGPTLRRQVSRASRPVQGRISGQPQRPVRPEARAVARLPAGVDPAPTSQLRPGLGASRIVSPAPDGLQAFPSRRPPRPEGDPWEPLGLRLGGVIVTPSVTQWGGYDSNPERQAPGGKGSAFSRTEGEVTARSDWSVHSFRANLRGGYNYYVRNREANRPDLTGESTLRLNVTRDADIDWDFRGNIDSQRPGSPNLNARALGRPLIFGYGTSLGVTQRFNRLSLNLRGSVDRASYENGRDDTGATIIQSDRDQTQYGLRLRAGYEVTPGLVPFVEVAADRRAFDRTFDLSGFRRSSDGYTARAGATFEVTRLLTGEASVGYQIREYGDPRLKDLRGLVGDAALIWTATPLTTVTLRGRTDLADTTIPGVSGSVNRSFTLEIAHALRRNWIVTGFAGLNRTAFDAIRLSEDTWQVGLRNEYRFTRNLALRASYTYERLVSTRAGSDYNAHVFLLGLRLQL